MTLQLRRSLFAVILAVAGMWVPVADAQTTFSDLEIGYQWIEIEGNEEMYRTQLNEDDGFVLRDLSLLVVDTEGESSLYDRFRIDASGFGGSPSGRLQLTSSLANYYRLRLLYQSFDQVSSVPGWANPLTGDAALPSLHTTDRDRQVLDLELELIPGQPVTPIIGYRWNRIGGRQRTTYHVGQDEMRLDSNRDETETELRLGAAFRAGSFRGSIIQGWRDLEVRETLQLAPDESQGLNLHPVLGTDVYADTMGRTVRSESETPVTTAHISGTIGERARLDLSYIHADAEGETFSDESGSGSLASFRIARFYQGFEESVESRTESPSWRGALRAKVELTTQLDLDVAYERRHRELEGWALIANLYLETVNFSGADPRDLSQLVEIENAYERDEDLIDLKLSAARLGPFSAWAGWSVSDTTTTVVEDAAQIIASSGQSGVFDREIDAFQLGAGVDIGQLRLLVDFESADADHAVLRTDYLDRSRLRGRVDWHPTEWLRLLATVEQIAAENDQPGIELDADTDHWALDLELQAHESLALHIAWDQYETESETVYRRPYDFLVEPSLHLEESELLEGSIDWQVDRLSLIAGYSTLDNEGSLPFELDRFFGRVAFDLSDTLGAAIELESNKYSEELFTEVGFDAKRFAIFLRWKR
jgi:hypothetical protein